MLLDADAVSVTGSNKSRLVASFLQKVIKFFDIIIGDLSRIERWKESTFAYRVDEYWKWSAINGA